MSTGAPLNLPKPKATTNTGQDMIEMGNSLQKINDAVGGLNTEKGAVPDGMSLNDVGTGSWAIMSSRTHSNLPSGITTGVLVVFSTGYGAFRGQVFIGVAGIWTRIRTGSLPGAWTSWMSWV